MLDSQRDPIHPGRGAPLLDFPHAPIGWMPDDARLAAKQEDLILTEQHWQVIRALQAFYAHHDETGIHRIELHDALDEKFHHQGGIKFLYLISYMPQLSVAGQLLRRNPAKNYGLSFLVGPFMVAKYQNDGLAEPCN